MILAVASGKGGTGKTTVALGLARTFGAPVQLLDCDVEAPNDRLFLDAEPRAAEPVNLLVPEVDPAACDACGLCSEICQYHAIVALGTEPLVFADLCHGCGGCARVCPRGAITEVPRPIGTVTEFAAGAITLIEGRLEVGVATAPPVIDAVRARCRDDRPAILDAPPGTSCPAVASLRGADFVVLVTEPTPFGLHDLRLAVDVVDELGLPAGVVVNRSGRGEAPVRRFCAAAGLPILAELPDDRRVAEAYARGQLPADVLPDVRARFTALWRAIGRAHGGAVAGARAGGGREES